MVDICFECCFTCIDCFLFYVFNIIVELKMVVCWCGEDIIDFSMGNLDGVILLYIVEKLCIVVQCLDMYGYFILCGILWLCCVIFCWYQDCYDVEIDLELEVIVIIGLKEGLVYLMLVMLDYGDMVLVLNLSYLIYIYGVVIVGVQVCLVLLVEGVDFFNELE